MEDDDEEFANWLNQEEIYFLAYANFFKDFPVHKSDVIKKEESSDYIRNIISSLDALFEEGDEEIQPLLLCSPYAQSVIKQEIKSELPELKFDIEQVLPTIFPNEMISQNPAKSSIHCDYLSNVLFSFDDEDSKDVVLKTLDPNKVSSHNVSLKTATKRKVEVSVNFYVCFALYNSIFRQNPKSREPLESEPAVILRKFSHTAT